MEIQNDLQLKLSALNILGVYFSAPPETKAFGRIWYNLAYKTMLNISHAKDIPVSAVIAAASALSPNNNWNKNVTDVAVLSQAFRSGAQIEDVKVSTYNNNKKKAWTILQHEKQSTSTLAVTGNATALIDQIAFQRETLNGLKTVAFYDCIYYAGNPYHIHGKGAVCVDGHAKNIYYGQRNSLSSNKSNIGKKEYYHIAAAYNAAAEIINGVEEDEPITGAQVQAITWNHWRDLHGIK